MRPRLYFRLNVDHMVVQGHSVPHIVMVEPLNPPGNNEDYLAEEIINYFRAAFRNELPHLSNTQIGQLRISIAASNINVASHRVSLPFQRFSSLHPDDLYDIIVIIQQSNQNIFMNDLEWTIIVDPRSYRTGRGTTDNALGLPVTRKKQYYESTPLSCMAYALIHLTKPRSAVKQRLTFLLMKQLGWGEETSISSCHDFVVAYPSFRVVVLYAYMPVVSKDQIFTGTSWSWDFEKMHDNNLYLIWDPVSRHFSATRHPNAAFRKSGAPHHNLCPGCFVLYRSTIVHECDFIYAKATPPTLRIICQYCGVVGVHRCTIRKCPFCLVGYANDTYEHRCLIIENSVPRKVVTDISQKASGTYFLTLGKTGPFALFAWDCESRFEEVQTERIQYSFDVDLGRYTGEYDAVTFMQKHVVNYVVFKNVYTGEGSEFSGDDCLVHMIHWLLAYNGGRNIMIAHNSGGYDTRLLFQTAKKMTSQCKLSSIMKGQKFMHLKIGRLEFIDSMLHVKGSLANLAKDYGAITEKGYFPYLFNTTNNWHYVGTIPPRHYFDITSSAKSLQDVSKFNEWYDSWVGPWSMQYEMKKYCRNDVDILATIIRGYGECCERIYQINPWFSKTAPGFNRLGIVRNLTKLMELPHPKDDTYIEKVTSLIPDSWVNLKTQEYWSARGALRGGRTIISCMLKTLTPDELARGWKICYQDVNSLYPSEQFFKSFPVGIPTVHVFDMGWKPCITPNHRNSYRCNCPDYIPISGMKVEFHSSWFSLDRIKSTHGIFHCSVKPPNNLMHPLLVAYHVEKKKCMATLVEDDYREGVFTSIELHRALEVGYVITDLHRIDEYKMSDAQWYDQITPLYIQKTINSSDPPQDVETYISRWREWAGDDIADGLLKAIKDGTFKKNPAMKMTSKISLNSGWGKHAQNPNMPKTLIMNHEKEMDDIIDLFTNVENESYEFISADALDEFSTQYILKDHCTKVTNSHGMYLPTAVFVPSYGRLTLWEELHKLGDRVLMCDTDSIVYIWKPEEYNIPIGDMIGQWAVEDIDAKHGGIVEFVGLGPKTYSCKAADGTTLVKAKGISLKHATTSIINHESMVAHAKFYLDTGIVNDFSVPSMTFEGTIHTGLATSRYLKVFGIRPNEFKGNLVGNYFYPFGFNE